MNFDFFETLSGMQLVLLAMLLVVGGVLLVFVLTAAARARQDVINEEHDRAEE